MSEPLFSEFPPVSTEQWETVIQKDLKGADYAKKLIWKTPEGIPVRPYYRAEDLPKKAPVQSSKENNNWLIRQDFDARQDLAEANRDALEALNRGVESIGFLIPPEGLGEQELIALTKGIVWEATEVNFTGGARANPWFIRQIDRQNRAIGDDVRGSVDFDPLRQLSCHGRFCDDEESSFSRLRAAVEASRNMPFFCSIGVGALIFHQAGSTIVQELAFGLAMASEYLHRVPDANCDVDEVAQGMKFTFAVGASYFMEIAKFRAARLLWANLVRAYGAEDIDSETMVIHAVTSTWNQTVYDPNVNMLRATTEAMSATLAGVDSLEVLPFDRPIRKPSAFSNRIARNTQVLLKEESYFDRVVDPAAGSYFIESLTASIAEEAWKLFKQVEEKGGYLAAFKAGFIQEQVKASAQKRDANIATRRQILLGTNQYPNFLETAGDEVTEATVTRAPGARPIMINDMGDVFDAEPTVEPIEAYRGAQAFEALRFATDRSGRQPTVFMLTFGNLAMCRARAQFACNFFACAGFKVVDNNRFETIEEGVEAALASDARIVVACAADDDYADAAPQIARLVGESALVVVAGDPASRPELEAKGINRFINVKSNVLETLRAYQQALGIA
ncbi:MAG: methylmalonyl-CoA mutase subunit beta [Prevotellaceae bacterium]|jgi:methylmalonyl-CoA mutase|nr:methylmalonyl-CoA mutase subunit beta [Prevotellaceae bacterium]